MKKMRKVLAAIATGRKTIRFGSKSAKRILGKEAAFFLALLLRTGVSLKEARCDLRWGKTIQYGCACDLYVTGLQKVTIPEKYEEMYPILKSKREKVRKILKEFNNEFHEQYVLLNRQNRGPYRVAVDHRQVVQEGEKEDLLISDDYNPFMETIPTVTLSVLDCDYIRRHYGVCNNPIEDEDNLDYALPA